MSPWSSSFHLVAVPCALCLLLLVSFVVCDGEEMKFEQASSHPDTACGVGYCHIDDRCVPAGQRDGSADSCWACNPTQSSVAWSYSDDEHCIHGIQEHLDTWHLILIIVGSVLLVAMLIALAGYRIRRHLLKRQRVYPSHYIDVPYDRPLLKQMH